MSLIAMPPSRFSNWLHRRLCVAVLLLACAPRAVLAGPGVWTNNWPYGGSIHAIAVDPQNPSTLYAGAENGVFKSGDWGATWAASSIGLPLPAIVDALAVNPEAPATIYAGLAGSGIFKSADGGSTWATFSAGLPSSIRVNSLAIDSGDPSKIYAGTSAGLFSITRSGAVELGPGASGSASRPWPGWSSGRAIPLARSSAPGQGRAGGRF